MQIESLTDVELLKKMKRSAESHRDRLVEDIEENILPEGVAGLKQNLAEVNLELLKVDLRICELVN